MTKGMFGGNSGGYTGGRAGRDFGIQALASGGRLPYTGLGTDKILGINSEGMPLALVDDLEWVVNRRSSDKYDGLLNRINQDHPSVHHLAHLKNGGRASGHEWTANSFSGSGGGAVSVTAPPVDTAAIGAAVASAIRSYQPVVNIGGRQFAGLMKQVTQDHVTRR